MDNVNLKSVRDIIILCFSSDEKGIRFDTDIVVDKGFPKADIEEAEKILSSSPVTFKAIKIIADIKYLMPEMAVIDPWFYYMEPVGLIIFVDRISFIPSYLFEEDLIAGVYYKRNIEFQLDYLENNSQCDVFGEPI